MGTAIVIGAETRVRGFGLAGIRVLPADSPEQVRAAWQGLTSEVTLVILTAAAAAALDDLDPGSRLVAVMT